MNEQEPTDEGTRDSEASGITPDERDELAEQASLEGAALTPQDGPMIDPNMTIGAVVPPVPPVPPPPSGTQAPRARTTFMRASALMMAAQLLARLVGFLRDTVIADKFGSTGLTDAYQVANSLPNFLSGVLQGGLNSVIVPTVSPYFGRGDMRRGYGLVNGVAVWMGAAALFLVLVVSVFAPEVVHLLGPGLTPAHQAAAVRMTRVLVWTVAFATYAYLGAAALIANDRFFYMSIGPIFMSGSATLVILFVHRPPIMLLAVGLLIGNILQFGFQVLPNLRHRRDFPPLREVRPTDPEVKAMMKRSWPALISSSVGQVNTIVDRIFGSFLPQGSITDVVLGNRIVQVPLGLFGYAISNASFPEMSRAYSEGRLDRVGSLLTRDLRFVLLLTVPITALLMSLSVPIVQAAYLHGHFTYSAASITAASMLAYAGSLIPFGLRTVVNRGYFLTNKMRILANMAMVLVVFNAAGDAIFSRLIGAPGLALGTTIDQWLSIGASFYFLYRALPALPVRATVDALWRAIVASAPLAVVAYVSAHALYRLAPHLSHTTLGRMAVVVIAALAGLAIGAIAFWLVRYPGLGEFVGRMRSRLVRR